jgi:hypothetical protein
VSLWFGAHCQEGREGVREGGSAAALTVILPFLAHGWNKAVVETGGGVGVVEDRLVLTEPALVFLVGGGGRSRPGLGPNYPDGIDLGEGGREGGRTSEKRQDVNEEAEEYER